MVKYVTATPDNKLNSKKNLQQLTVKTNSLHATGSPFPYHAPEAKSEWHRDLKAVTHKISILMEAETPEQVKQHFHHLRLQIVKLKEQAHQQAKQALQDQWKISRKEWADMV